MRDIFFLSALLKPGCNITIRGENQSGSLSLGYLNLKNHAKFLGTLNWSKTSKRTQGSSSSKSIYLRGNVRPPSIRCLLFQGDKGLKLEWNTPLAKGIIYTRVLSSSCTLIVENLPKNNFNTFSKPLSGHSYSWCQIFPQRDKNRREAMSCFGKLALGKSY